MKFFLLSVQALHCLLGISESPFFCKRYKLRIFAGKKMLLCILLCGATLAEILAFFKESFFFKGWKEG